MAGARQPLFDSHPPPEYLKRGPDGGPTETMEGYADLHSHIFGNLGFGGTVLWGGSHGEPEEGHKRIEPFGRRFSHRFISFKAGFPEGLGLETDTSLL